MNKSHKIFLIWLVSILLLVGPYIFLNILTIKKIKSLGLSTYYEEGAKKECGVIAVMSQSCCLDIIKEMEDKKALFYVNGECPDGYIGLGTTCGFFSPSGCYKTGNNLLEPEIHKSDDFDSTLNYRKNN